MVRVWAHTDDDGTTWVNLTGVANALCVSTRRVQTVMTKAKGLGWVEADRFKGSNRVRYSFEQIDPPVDNPPESDPDPVDNPVDNDDRTNHRYARVRTTGTHRDEPQVRTIEVPIEVPSEASNAAAVDKHLDRHMTFASQRIRNPTGYAASQRQAMHNAHANGQNLEDQWPTKDPTSEPTTNANGERFMPGVGWIPQATRRNGSTPRVHP